MIMICIICVVVQSIGSFTLQKVQILGRYLLSGILLILLSLRPWGVAARPDILVNRGGNSYLCIKGIKYIGHNDRGQRVLSRGSL
jgi:hypothetical protein